MIPSYETPDLWWRTIEDRSGPQIAQIALRLVTRVPSSAGIERLFSSLAWIKNKYRNRLSIDRLEMNACIKTHCHNNLSFAEKHKDHSQSEEEEEIISCQSAIDDLGEQANPEIEEKFNDPFGESLSSS